MTPSLDYGKGYPCLYGLSGGFAVKTDEGFTYVLKNGSTWHAANRKSGARTYFPEKPIFEYVLVLDPAAFSSPDELYILDAEFIEFLKRKGMGRFYVTKEGGKEWFLKSCPVDYKTLRLEFLAEKDLPILAILDSDPFPIHDLSESETEEVLKEDARIKRLQKRTETLTLYDKFCSTFLQNKVPRRIQTELWNCFSKLTESKLENQYKGIVQWPTGCGKTIAILMLIVLAKEYCSKHGLYYRGLFVSPKNDILDTISEHFGKLSSFGIKVYDGSNQKFSKLTIPSNEHCLVMACHSALLSEHGMRSLPSMTHVHYDEVHRITGELYFKLLQEMMNLWKTCFLTGTSATPQTSSADQRRKMAELFGDPLIILHKCNVDEAVKEGWIAKPRFHVRILEKNEDRPSVLEAFVDSAVDLVNQKSKGGKNIYYIETSVEDVKYALSYARKKYPHLKFYAAIDGERTDDAFLNAVVNEVPHILFACQRYREGSDIPGLEITGKLMGNTTAAHNLIQISGRALRIDYPDKEGWCLIARPSEAGTSIEDVLDSILLEIMDFLGKTNKTLEPKEIPSLVKSYFGGLSIDGNRCSLEETIDRVQAAYVRTEFVRKTPKERYSLLQSHNKELCLTSKYEYLASREKHPRFVENPQVYFKDCWISWYDFLGVDTSKFPQTKADWIRICKERELISWEIYKKQTFIDLPINPGEIYSDFTNWDAEFGVEEEIVW